MSKADATPGYSGRPLAAKLGIAAEMTVAAPDAPAEFRQWLAPLPAGVRITRSIGRSPDLVVVFATRAATMGRRLVKAADAVYPDGAVWAAWPKKASRVPTDVTEDVIRAFALERGLVDNKVCAISEVWSGLRVVWRVQNRGRASVR